jgi:hypothetical protein
MVCFACVAVACGRSAETAARLGAPPTDQASPPADRSPIPVHGDTGAARAKYEHPFGGAGSRVSSIDEAQRHVPFPIYRPQGVPEPTAIFYYAEHPDQPPRHESGMGDTGFAVQYQISGDGLVMVDELPWDQPSADWAAYVDDAVNYDNTYTAGDSKKVTIRHGQDALLTAAPPGQDGLPHDIGVRWLEGRVLVSLDAPNLTEEKLLDLANRI